MCTLHIRASIYPPATAPPPERSSRGTEPHKTQLHRCGSHARNSTLLHCERPTFLATIQSSRSRPTLVLLQSAVASNTQSRIPLPGPVSHPAGSRAHSPPDGSTELRCEAYPCPGPASGLPNRLPHGDLPRRCRPHSPREGRKAPNRSRCHPASTTLPMRLTPLPAPLRMSRSHFRLSPSHRTRRRRKSEHPKLPMWDWSLLQVARHLYATGTKVFLLQPQ